MIAAVESSNLSLLTIISLFIFKKTNRKKKRDFKNVLNVNLLFGVNVVCVCRV